jgi:hypothetical protein
LARRRIFGRPVVTNTDEAMIRELRRMGGLAKAIYLSTEGATGPLTGGILVEIRNYIAKLSGDFDDRKKG